jgi:hypothetical protein
VGRRAHLAEPHHADRERCRDLFGRESWRWRVVRTSNACVFNDPLQRAGGLPASKSENPTGTPNQDVSSVSASQSVPARDPNNPLERALQSLGITIEALNKSEGADRIAAKGEISCRNY